eukprot:TRINITY_DN9684_c0_g2_i1.p1 TRINITY_DN9684_c0_g2~~TRINITY_DN9684_c0_g2_i1.p1  ORF type:complete len:280 (-),score=26.34 TRINITY_DN9684_c0_g2_i1:263-1102(-)
MRNHHRLAFLISSYLSREPFLFRSSPGPSAGFPPAYALPPCSLYSALAIEVDADGQFQQAQPNSLSEEIISAWSRPLSGRLNAKKERKAGRCPSIVYEHRDGHLSGHRQLISVESKQILRLLQKYGRTFFLSRTFELEVQHPAEETHGIAGPLTRRERVLPRQVHLHAGSDELLNITFVRATPGSRIKVHVPLVFIGEDACVGIRKGGWLNTIKRSVLLECSAEAIPQSIEVDLSNLNVGQKVLFKDLPGIGGDVRLMVKDETLPVCKIAGSNALVASS